MLCVAAGGKKQHAGHHAPSSGPHAGDKKSKNQKGSGATKKGTGQAPTGYSRLFELTITPQTRVRHTHKLALGHYAMHCLGWALFVTVQLRLANPTTQKPHTYICALYLPQSAVVQGALCVSRAACCVHVHVQVVVVASTPGGRCCSRRRECQPWTGAGAMIHVGQKQHEEQYVQCGSRVRSAAEAQCCPPWCVWGGGCMHTVGPSLSASLAGC